MKSLEGKKAINYCRVSTTDQKDHGYSLSDQKEKLKEFCAQNSIILDSEYIEDCSAKTFTRPEFSKLISHATKHRREIDYLLVHKWDRFSRNAHEALGIIKVLASMGIEVNSIEQWIDHEDPSQLIMLLIYLGIPEVENKVKSERVINGNRRALREGRWIHHPPKGYVSGRDDLGKVLMKPEPEIFPLLAELFKDFAMGRFSQNELLKLPKYKRLQLSKSNLSRMLKHIIYAGKILIPSYKDEPETIVNGLHKPLISIDLFKKIQFQLSNRIRYKQKANTMDSMLPLRGFLTCSKCGGNLTGSGSTSKTGAKHYYYHCNTEGCGERFRIKDAHLKLEQIFSDMQPDEEVCKLFEIILEERHKVSEESKYSQLKMVEEEIEKVQKRERLLTDKLLDEVVNDETYKKLKKEMVEVLGKLLQEKENLSTFHKDTRQFGILSPACLPIPPPGIILLRRCRSSKKNAVPDMLTAIKLSGDGIRTRDPDLGKVVLYQLSYYYQCKSY